MPSKEGGVDVLLAVAVGVGIMLVAAYYCEDAADPEDPERGDGEGEDECEDTAEEEEVHAEGEGEDAADDEQQAQQEQQQQGECDDGSWYVTTPPGCEQLPREGLVTLAKENLSTSLPANWRK